MIHSVQNVLQKQHTLPENPKAVSVNVSLGRFHNHASFYRKKSTC